MVEVSYDNRMEMYGDEKLQRYLGMQPQRFHWLEISMKCLVTVYMSVQIQHKAPSPWP